MSETQLRNFSIATSLVALGLLAWIFYGHQPTHAGALHTSSLPALNAAFNCISAAFLLLGFAAIKTGQQEWHRRAMLGAFTASTLFLVGYLVHHYQNGETRYPPLAPLRGLYLMILGSHIALSAIALPLILYTFALALTQRFEAHKKWVRYTLPLWLYVSVTGVAIFLMLRSALAR